MRLDSFFFSYSSLESDSVKIYEFYTVKKGPLIKITYGTWHENTSQLDVPQPFMWQRRSNLQGVELIDTVLEWKPFLVLDPNGGVFNATGISIDLMKHLQKALNFTVKRISPKDGEWGIISEVNGTIVPTGLFGDLISGDADMSTCGLYMTKERQTHGDMIDFMPDITTVIMPNTLMQSGPNLDTLAYINIFPLTVWILILSNGALFVLACSYSKNLLSNHETKTPLELIIDNLQGSFLVLLQLEVEIPLEKLVLKVLFLTASLASYVIYATYCSDLTALMTHRPPPAPLRNFQVIFFLPVVQQIYMS